MVSTKTTVGSIGLLANHQPLLAMLDPTELRLYKSESDVVRYAQGEGFLQISGTQCLVLVDEVFEVDQLDAATSRTASRRPRRRSRRRGGHRGAPRRRARPAPLRGVPEDRRAAELSPAQPRRYPLAMDERALTERLITYDTSNVDGLRAAVGFIKGWSRPARSTSWTTSSATCTRSPRWSGRPRTATDARLPRPLRRRARPPGAVRPAHRGRPAVRPRRLRHEGRRSRR